MPDPQTTNLGLITPPNAADPGTWDVPVNQNAHTLDAALGNVTTLNLQGLTGVQALPITANTNVVLTGAPSGAITLQTPAGVGRFFFVANACTGANATVNFGSASVAPVVAIPGGFGAAIVIDSVNGGRRADSIAEEAAGPTGAVQYVGPGGFFAGDAGLLYTLATQALAIGGPLSAGGNFTLGGQLVSPLIVNGGGATTLQQTVPFATSVALDCSKSNVFSTSLSGNITVVNIANMQDGQTINWRLTQGVANSLISWPGSFRWPGGTAPVLSTGATVTDLLVATFFASTATWLANLIKGFPA